MYLCDFCKKGKLEMCPYFRDHFLEEEGYVSTCPEFEQDDEEDEMEGIM